MSLIKFSFSSSRRIAISPAVAQRANKGEQIFRGIPVSAGVCRGKIIVLDKPGHSIEHTTVADADLNAEIGHLQKSLTDTRHQLQGVQRRIAESIGAEEARIFDAHLMVLEDPSLIDEAVRMILSEKTTAAHAFHTAAERYAKALDKVEDEFLRERANDMRDVTGRVLSHLLGHQADVDIRHLAEPCILIAHDLTPSKTAQLDRAHVLGFATDIGSRTSHTAIMARSLHIPAVVGLKTISQELETGDYVLVDGFNGMVILNPTEQTLFEYGQLVRKQVSLEEKLREVLDQPAVTLDGHRITLSANIEQAADAEAVLNARADGVGLFRTEYLFINRDSPPGEDEQFEEYRKLATALKPHPVVIRTLDLGGDKFLSSLHIPAEMNPFLGWRAIRFCLQQTDVFTAQLRAILRASAEGNVKMMYPMISGLDELVQANALVNRCKDELRARNIPFDDKLEAGVMIEIPSAVLVADALAKRSPFFSIGTNDLIQYTLAVDRMNEKIAHLYEPTHPAILRLIKTTVDAAHARNVWVSVCGEMAGDPVLAPLLIGLGVDELSATPSLLAQIKFLIRRIKLSEAKELATFALDCESPTEILSRCQTVAKNAAPGLFDTKK